MPWPDFNALPSFFERRPPAHLDRCEESRAVFNIQKGARANWPHFHFGAVQLETTRKKKRRTARANARQRVTLFNNALRNSGELGKRFPTKAFAEGDHPRFSTFKVKIPKVYLKAKPVTASASIWPIVVTHAERVGHTTERVTHSSP